MRPHCTSLRLPDEDVHYYCLWLYCSNPLLRMNETTVELVCIARMINRRLLATIGNPRIRARLLGHARGQLLLQC
jgi:hypothetical protein